MKILQTTDLKKYYGTEPNITRALDGVNFSVEEGEFVAVVGTSGFLGATFDGDTPVFSPVLPSGWKALRMNFYWRGEFYRLMVFEGRYSISRV